MLRSGLKAINWVRPGSHDVSIGVVDSIDAPSDDWVETLNEQFDTELSFSDESDDLTSLSGETNVSHGEHVLDILAACAPTATTFTFYKVTELGHHVDEGNVVEALNRMVSDGVDIANLSLGVPKVGDESRTALGRATRGALDRGLVIVAAAGNESDVDESEGESNTVFYPARFDGVVSVGGFVSVCTDDEHCDGVPYAFESNDQTVGPFCGRHENLDTRCEGADTDRRWDGNVERTGDDPVVYAPIHYPCRRAETLEPELNVGTSYAAPLVTGQLAVILRELDLTVDPRTLADELDRIAGADDLRRFSGLETLVALSDRQ